MADAAVLAGAEPPRRDAVAVATAAAAAAGELRHTRMVADLERWRAIVNAIAAGEEPTGAVLAEVGELADRLQLQAGALADDVRAAVAERKQTARIADDEAALQRQQAEGPALAGQLEDARREVRRLEALIAGQRAIHTSFAGKLAAVATLRENNPRLFDDPATLARRVLARETGRSWSATKGN